MTELDKDIECEGFSALHPEEELIEFYFKISAISIVCFFFFIQMIVLMKKRPQPIDQKVVV